MNIFLRQCIRIGGLPFDVRMDVPNKVTDKAIKEGGYLAKNKQVRGHRDLDEMQDAIEE